MTRTTPRQRVVAIFHGPSASATLPEIVSAAEGLCRVRFLFRKDVAERSPALVRLAEKLAGAVEYDGVKDLLAPTEELDEVSGVVTFRDDFIEDAEAVADALGLRGGPADGAADRWRKDAQRRLLTAAGASSVEGMGISTVAELVGAAGRLGFPAFVKPARASGSECAFRVENQSSLAAALPELAAQMEEHARTFVYEQEIAPGEHPLVSWLGDYVSVESATSNGRRWHFAICDRLPVAEGVRETGFSMPTALPHRYQQAVIEATERALDALAVDDKVTHTEVKIGTDGAAQVIEVNGRLGGNVHRLQTRIDAHNPVKIALQVALGDDPVSEHPGPIEKVALFLRFPPPPGRFVVTRAIKVGEARGWDGVYAVDRVLSEGATVDANIGTDSSLADVWLEADRGNELAARLRRVIAELAERYVLEPRDDNKWVKDMIDRLSSGSPGGLS